MIHLLMAHPGAHVNKDTLGALPLFFCRVLRLPWQKQAAPEPPSTPSGAATALLADAEPVMRDRTIPEVRAEYDEHPCAAPAAHGKAAPYLCTVPPHHCLSPEGEPATPAPWRLSAAMTTGELTALDERTSALLRPVNGRSLGTQPRRHPDDGQAVNVERGMARAAGLRDRERYEPAPVPLLRQVLGALRNMDTPAAGYRGGWQ